MQFYTINNNSVHTIFYSYQSPDCATSSQEALRLLSENTYIDFIKDGKTIIKINQSNQTNVHTNKQLNEV